MLLFWQNVRYYNKIVIRAMLANIYRKYISCIKHKYFSSHDFLKLFFIIIKIMQCPSCHHVMAQRHDDKQFFYFLCKNNTCFAAGIQCKFCNLLKQSKKGYIKNIKYIMLKHYKQEHQHWCKPSTLLHCNIDYNNTTHIVSHNPVHSLVNPTDSISTISSLSNLKQTNSVALSSSTVDTQAINFLFYQFNYFDSQPNQLYFFLNMFHP